MHPPTPSPELINFCLQSLVDISSTAVSADECPLSNLASISASVRSRGFRVEHFIRPPVQLDFEFRLPVNVACVIVQPELVPHSEMRLEVAASFHNASVCSNLVKICPNVVVKDNQTLLLLENKAFKIGDGKVLSNFKTDLTSCQVEGSFMNQSVLSRALGTGVAVQPLKHPNILAKLRQLRLTVTRITGPRPLSLKSLEVWGSPSSGSCTTPNQLECLWSCLTAVGRENSKASSEGVKLYCSKNSSPEQAGQQDIITANDLHRTYADTDQACRYARDQKTMSSHEQKSTEVECGSLGQEECHCEWPRVQRGPVFGGAATDTQEVGHIKELTSENKKSLKPQQRVTRAAHLHGCSHNIGKDKQKPGPSSSSCRSGSRREWLEGKNGSPPSTSLQLQPNHNTSSRDHDETISQYSCSLWISNNNKAAIDHKQQQQLEDSAQTLPTSSNHPEIPSEFLDKITYEVMHIPMLLPSGHCVDRSTVEKLGNNDALYGRPPTDPFTGIHFSGTSKPEFFPELKLRLDRFLSSRAEYTSLPATTTTSARTLGTADQIAAHLCRVGRTGGAGRCSRDGAGEEGSSQEPPPKRLRSKTIGDTSHAGPGESACHNTAAAGVGSDAIWASLTTGSPSYERGSPGSPIKDQRTTHRMPTHDYGPCSSSTQANHNFQQVRNQFEEEVAGSLDQALKQLLSD